MENKDEFVWQSARRMAKTVLDDMREYQGGTLHYPIDIEDYVINRLGISVSYQPLEKGVSGYIHKPRENADVEIVINSLDCATRRRFTLAHEIGHLKDREEMGDLSYTFIDKRGGDYNINEFYADEFAGALLIPSEELFDLVKSSSSLSVKALAQYFNVSQSALSMRLRRLVESND